MAKGCFLVAFGIIALYFITSCILYKGAMFTAAGALRLANTVVYALICLAITFFLSSFVKNNNTVNIFVNAFGLGSAFICGVFVPRQFLADGVIAAGRFFPAYWYVNNEEAASNLSAASASSIVLNFTIQLMFALAFMVLAIVISSKKRTETKYLITFSDFLCYNITDQIIINYIRRGLYLCLKDTKASF